MTFRAADIVRHIPSGAELVLACDEHLGTVTACGYPMIRVPAADVEIVTAADRDRRLAMLRTIAGTCDERGRLAREQIGETER